MGLWRRGQFWPCDVLRFGSVRNRDYAQSPRRRQRNVRRLRTRGRHSCPSALALGYFLFYSKVAGVYFGIVTLALSVVFETLAIVNRDITGGLDGLYGFAIPTIWIPGLGNIEIWGTANPYYVGPIGLVLAYAVSVWITRSSFGTAIKAIRDDEARLEMLGYNTAFLKTVLLVIACAMAGIAGTLYTTVGLVSSSSSRSSSPRKSLSG